jgi:hypothetical protein
MDWKQFLAYITGSVDQKLLLPNKYLVMENRILRQQIQGRVRLERGERKTLAETGRRLGKKALAGHDAWKPPPLPRKTGRAIEVLRTRGGINTIERSGTWAK